MSCPQTNMTERKGNGRTIPPGSSCAHLSGVERRFLLTSTLLPLSVVRVYGLTGTIFFPSFVFDIIKNIYRPATCRPLLLSALLQAPKTL